MNEQLHLIVVAERGTPRNFHFSKKGLCIAGGISTLLLIVLTMGALYNTGLFASNKILLAKVISLKKTLNQSDKSNREYVDQIAALNKEHARTIAELKLQSELQVSKLRLEKDKQIAALEMKNIKQETFYKEEREQLLSTAVSDLNVRSGLIESVMRSIGVKLKSPKDKAAKASANRGGPYIATPDSSHDELLYRADRYLDFINKMPLGRPVGGRITSAYGKRTDPLNGKNGFHPGIDFRGKRGERIRATADGTVIQAQRNGGYGNFVKIDHGNGYTTSYAHMQNYHVKKGDRVTRGQIIGLVGNTGRSTGPHLHYEIHKNNKTVNPRKFMKVADLSHTLTPTSETN